MHGFNHFLKTLNQVLKNGVSLLSTAKALWDSAHSTVGYREAFCTFSGSPCDYIPLNMYQKYIHVGSVKLGQYSVYCVNSGSHLLVGVYKVCTSQHR